MLLSHFEPPTKQQQRWKEDYKKYSCITPFIIKKPNKGIINF
jgi:hypothetical protein